MVETLAPSGDVRTFSYAAELASPDVALSALTRCLEALRLIRHVAFPGREFLLAHRLRFGDYFLKFAE